MIFGNNNLVKVNKNNNTTNNTTFSFTNPDGYNIVEQTKEFSRLSNGQDTIYVYQLESNDTVENYKEQFSSEFNISDASFDMDGVNKTIAVKDNTTVLKYWFTKDNKNFQVQIFNNNDNSDNIAKTIIESFSVKK